LGRSIADKLWELAVERLRSPRATSAAISSVLRWSIEAMVRLLPTVDLVSDTGDHSAKRGEFFSFDQRVLDVAQMSKGRFSGVPGASDFPLSALAFSNLLGSHIDRDYFAILRSQWMPIGDPGAVLDLICTLSRDFDANDRLSSFHDRTHDPLDRIRQRSHAVPDKSPDMSQRYRKSR
jgi:hypothetical protein